MSNTNDIFRRIKQILLPGLLSVLVLLILLLFAAALANSLTSILAVPALAGKLCLTLAAVLCGLLCAGKSETGKLAAALSGEAVLLAALLIGCAIGGRPLLSLSILLDLACLVFGGFAGALLASRGGRRKRRRR